MSTRTSLTARAGIGKRAPDTGAGRPRAELPSEACAAPGDKGARLGMWVFLAGEVLFFGVVFLTYGIARLHAPQGFALASAKTDIWIGTLNTALLLISSAVIAIAAEAAQCSRPRDAVRCLWVCASLGLMFLALKGVEYRAEWREGLFPGPGFRIDGQVVPSAELFFAWYFFATALHALHLGLGVVLCAVFALRIRSRAQAQPGARGAKGTTIGATEVLTIALYWHFVDIVWIVLFPLIYLVGPRS